MSKTDSRPIPREHGAWVVLGTCWLFGIFTADAVAPLPAALLLVAALAGFALTEPARLLAFSLRSGRTTPRRRSWIRWIVLLAVAAAAAAIPLAILRPHILWALPPAVVLFVTYLRMTSRRASMTDLSIIGFLALSLVAPLARIAADGGGTPAGLAVLWLFTALFFCASAWCVRVRLVGSTGLPLAAAAHSGLLALTSVLVARELLPAIALVAIAPAMLRFVWVLLDVARYRKQTLKRIGIVETALALVLVAAGVLF
jgi:hypothetical protein